MEGDLIITQFSQYKYSLPCSIYVYGIKKLFSHKIMCSSMADQSPTGNFGKNDSIPFSIQPSTNTKILQFVLSFGILQDMGSFPINLAFSVKLDNINYMIWKEHMDSMVIAHRLEEYLFGFKSPHV